MKTKYVPAIATALLSLSTLIIQPSTALAQPTNFTYQGQLTEGGTPANGIYDFLFVIYNGPDFSAPGISALSSTEVDDLAVTNGLFTSAIPFQAWIFSGEQRWLEVQVRTNDSGEFTGLLPWTEITPTPYAMRAFNVTSNAFAAGFDGPVSFTNTANVFVGDGSGLTNVTLDGLDASDFWQLGGNAGTTSGADFVGTVDSQSLDFKVNNQRALRLEPGGSDSVNLVAGWAGNRVAAGIGGATIGGGGAGNFFGSAWTNSVESDLATVSGGADNAILTNATSSTIGGGFRNIIDGASLTVVTGGSANRVLRGSFASAIGGGRENSIGTNAPECVIGGGAINSIENETQASVIGGGGNNDIYTDTFASTISGGFVNKIGTGVYYAVIGGGHLNNVSGNTDYAMIGGGRRNQVQTNADYCTIAGGGSNRIGEGADYGVVTGGSSNEIGDNAQYSTIGGGWSNSISGDAWFATIPGGRDNSVGPVAWYALAAGYRAKANHVGAFVWADSQNADFASTADDQFLIRASGGVGIGTTSPAVPLHVDGGTDTSVSGGGYLVSGSVAGLNISLDNNEIMARSNGVTSSLFLNVNGGTVAIGTSSADQTYTLLVNGTAAKPGGGSWSTSSDARLKDVGQPFTRGLEDLVKIEPKHYHYSKNNALRLPSDREYVGLIAQEVEAAIPEAIEPNDTGYLHVNNDPILWTMLNSIKELNQKLESENAELKQRLAALERLMANQISN